MGYRALLLTLAALLMPKACVAWTTVGSGIEYQRFTLPDPNNVYVSRMDRSNLQATIESSLANGRMSGSREVVSAQASRYDESINYWGGAWGKRSDVVVAVNGDWFYWTGLVYGGIVHSGWYCKPVYCEFGGNQFAWSLSRTPYIGGCTHLSSSSFTIGFPYVSKSLAASGLNRSRGADELIIYTPQFDSTTKTSPPGVEVVVEMASPTLIRPALEPVTGIVRQVRENQAGAQIPFDSIVLSATGTAASQLLGAAAPGALVTLSQTVISNEAHCSSPSTYDWRDTYASVGGGHAVLQNGVVQDYSADPVMANRHPRTCVAYNDSYVFLVVCDGRSAVSRGMTGVELATFCKNTLGATWALNLDGGGSSTMVVNGGVVNVPSDGAERAVGNGLMMVNVLPRLNSFAFCAGQHVSTSAQAALYLGPGTNYASTGSVAPGTVGNVVHHSLNGVSAKGSSWWKVDLGAASGWVAQSSLSAYGAFPPTIVTHPSPAAGCAGFSATFSIEARGSGTLSYQWYHNGSPIASGQYYSGANTPTLNVLSVDADRAGDYHCVVASAYGSATSNPASLTVAGVKVSIGPPSVAATRSGPVTYTVTYTGASSITLTAGDVQLNKTGSANGAVSIMGGSGYRLVVVSTITGNGTLGISIAPGTAVGDCATPGAGPSATFIVDNTAPGSVTVTDEGAYTPSLTTLSASWTPASDGAGSGIAGYQYSVGTFSGGANVKPWTSVGDVTSVTSSSLALVEGTTYYLQVRAVDKVGLVGAAGRADGITAAAGVAKIGDAWWLEDSRPLSLRGKAVTAARAGAFWLEETDRSAAVKVLSNAAVARGDLADAAGVLGLRGGQRVLLADVVHTRGGDGLVSPLGLALRDLGACAVNERTPGVTSGRSAYGVGLLVRCWGRVTATDSTDPHNRFFRIDDGSVGTEQGSTPGVKVICGDAEPPPVGCFVAVTGVVDSELIGNDVFPVLILRDSADLRRIKCD